MKAFVLYRDYLKTAERLSAEPKGTPKKEEEKPGFFSDEEKQ